MLRFELATFFTLRQSANHSAKTRIQIWQKVNKDDSTWNSNLSKPTAAKTKVIPENAENCAQHTLIRSADNEIIAASVENKKQSIAIHPFLRFWSQHIFLTRAVRARLIRTISQTHSSFEWSGMRSRWMMYQKKRIEIFQRATPLGVWSVKMNLLRRHSGFVISRDLSSVHCGLRLFSQERPSNSPKSCLRRCNASFARAGSQKWKPVLFLSTFVRAASGRVWRKLFFLCYNWDRVSGPINLWPRKCARFDRKNSRMSIFWNAGVSHGI